MKKSMERQLTFFGDEPEQLYIDFDSEPDFPHSEPEEEEQCVPEGEHRYYVYAWRWRSDKRYAKIGRTRNGFMGVRNRMVATYNPIDYPFLLGVKKCDDMEHSEQTEKDILDRLTRTPPKREWVETNDRFEEEFKSFEKMDNAELKERVSRYKTHQRT